jgi:hypothetical protein
MLLTLVAIAALADTPQAQPSSPPEKPKLICRDGEAQLGTHMRAGRRCKTAEQWTEEEYRTRNAPPPPSLTIHKDQLEGAPNVQPQ